MGVPFPLCQLLITLTSDRSAELPIDNERVNLCWSLLLTSLREVEYIGLTHWDGLTRVGEFDPTSLDQNVTKVG